MTLTQLAYFREVARLNSFTKAANKLFISQSTLSKSIKALEDEYQVALINRGTKSFELTKEGELLFEYAERILNYYDMQVAEFEERLNETNNGLRIGIPPTVGAIYCNSVIAKTRRMYPEIQLEIEQINSKKIIESILEGKLDVGFVLDTFEDSRLDKKTVIASEAVLIVSRDHRWGKKRTISFNEIQNERLLMINPEYTYYDLVKDKCHQAGFEPQFSFESYQWEFIFEMVAQGQGVTIFPKPLINKFNNARVHCVHLENPEFGWYLAAIRLKNRLVSTPMKKFWNILDE